MSGRFPWKIFAVLMAICVASFIVFFSSLTRIILTFALNSNPQLFVADSVHIGGVDWDPRLRIMVRNVNGQIVSDMGPVPFEIALIRSENSLLRIGSRTGTTFTFSGVRLRHSQFEGMEGTAEVRAGTDWFLKVRADIRAMDLSEFEWLEPENLRGSKGKLTGGGIIELGSGGKTNLILTLHSKDEGGLLQAHLFGLLIPYLPSAKQVSIKRVASTGGLVAFKEASLYAETEGSEELKVLFHIVVPEYNLNLNLNVRVRVDREDGLWQFARLAGLVKAKVHL